MKEPICESLSKSINLFCNIQNNTFRFCVNEHLANMQKGWRNTVRMEIEEYIGKRKMGWLIDSITGSVWGSSFLYGWGYLIRYFWTYPNSLAFSTTSARTFLKRSQKTTEFIPITCSVLWSSHLQWPKQVSLILLFKILVRMKSNNKCSGWKSQRFTVLRVPLCRRRSVSSLEACTTVECFFL